MSTRRRTPLPRSPRGTVATTVRRATLSFLGLQVFLAMVLSLVDSYRRRAKPHKPFPVTAPAEVVIGDGTITTYTYGADVYDDMLAAIGRAEHQVLFETYIWKGDQVGQRFKSALSEAAGRAVDI